MGERERGVKVVNAHCNRVRRISHFDFLMSMLKHDLYRHCKTRLERKNCVGIEGRGKSGI